MISEDVTPTEDCIRKIWMEILTVDQIRPEQGFFELGGDSFLMIDMIFIVGKRLNLEIDPALLFEDASLAGFARLVDATRSAADSLAEGNL